MTVKKTNTMEVSDTNFDKEAKDFGEQLKNEPKVKIRLHLPADEKAKYEALEAQNKNVIYPTEVIILNGYRYEIRRGVEVEVPEPIADMAKEAGYC